MCTQATRDKLIIVMGFTDTERTKDFVKLILAIRGITLHFKSNKDMSTALTRSLTHILKFQQGPTK